MMPGTVICQILRNRLAPSTSAASYSSWSMPAIAARYRIAPQPRDFHQYQAIMVDQTCELEARKLNSSLTTPSWTRMWFTTPLSTENSEKASA
ncbi:hypothetical protein D3C75_1197600 [compost metagenome]